MSLTSIAVLLVSIGLLVEFTLSTTLGILAAVAIFLVALELLMSSGTINLRRD